MEDLKAHERRRGPTRIKGTAHGVYGRTPNRFESRKAEEEAPAARLKQLSAPTIILE